MWIHGSRLGGQRLSVFSNEIRVARSEWVRHRPAPADRWPTRRLADVWTDWWIVFHHRVSEPSKNTSTPSIRRTDKRRSRYFPIRHSLHAESPNANKLCHRAATSRGRSPKNVASRSAPLVLAPRTDSFPELHSAFF